jgi:nicotinamide-nucleotide amidase
MGENAFRIRLKTDDMRIESRPFLALRLSWLILLFLVCSCLKGEVARAIPVGTFENGKNSPTRYMIVVTGGELLSGVYPDGHTYFITRTLRPLGLQCVGSMCVDDKQADLEEALRFATGKAPLVIVTGGLGPTDNDITREALSGFTNIPLKEHPDALQEMARRFRTSPDRLRSNLRRQTQAPVHGTYFKNTNGTAIGLAFEQPDGAIVALPGPPRELQAMVRNELVPYLSRRFGTRLPGCALTLRFVGLGQSQIDQTLEDHVPLPPDVTVSSQFEGGRVDFTFSLPDDTPQDRARLQDLKQDIVKYLGDNIYADDETSLEAHVINLLEARSGTLVLAEVGSGGSFVAALSSADSAHRVLMGAHVAPTEETLRKLLGVTNSQRLEQLAESIAGTTTNRWVVVVGEVQPGEGNASYVTVVFRRPDGTCENGRIRIGGSGELAQSRLVTRLLDEFRRILKPKMQD